MMLPATCASLLIAATATLLSAPAASAAPLTGRFSLSVADAAPVVQVQQDRRRADRTGRTYRSGNRYGSPYDSYGYGSPYGAYGYYDYGSGPFAGQGCVHGTPSETSAYPSWMVCNRR